MTLWPGFSVLPPTRTVPASARTFVFRFACSTLQRAPAAPVTTTFGVAET